MAVNHLKFCACIQGSLCRNTRVDGSRNVLEYLDGGLNNVKELMGSSEDLDGDVLLKDLNYRFLMVNDVAATPIVCQKEPGSPVSCTVG